MTKNADFLILLALSFLLVPGVGAFAAADVRPTEGYLPEFSRTVERAERERIPLRIDFPEGLALESWPVTFGVPFPRGALASAENVRLVTGAGGEAPAQIRTTATWEGPDGDVKWILVDASISRGEEYFLEYGTFVRPREVETPLRVRENARGVEVVTGPLRMVFSRESSHLIGGAWLDANGDGVFSTEEQLLAPLSRMYLIDQDGRRYETSDHPEDYRVEVEESGPLRAVVRAEGWYRDESGEGLCKYITRVHLHAGEEFARVEHTFIVAFDSNETQLRDIAVPFALAGEEAESAAFQIGTGYSSPVFDAPVHSYLVQDTARRFTLHSGDGTVLHEGERAGGWAHLESDRGGIAVGLANLWQDYAKELETRPGGVIAHLWPRHSDRLLDLSARGQLGPLYDEWDRVYHANWYRGGLDRYDQAMGLAKSNELLVALHGPGEAAADRARLTAAALEQRPIVSAPAEWMSASDAFGPLHPKDPDRFPEAEKAYEAAFEHFQFLQENIYNHADHIGNYGFFDYGDTNYGIHLNREENRWEPRPWRRMASRFYGVHLMPWLQFARTGERQHLEWALASARHVMDIDMCHVTNTSSDLLYPKYAGGRYGGNGGIIHYGGNIYDIGPDSHVAPWMYAYYLTGYRRAWDVLLLEGEFYLDRFEANNRLNRYAHRGSGGALRAMVDLWEATWDERYLDAAQQLAELFYQAAEADPDGLTRHDDVYMNGGMIAYYRATGDERMRELILHNMRNVSELTVADGDPRAFTAYGPTMAYYFTGDSSFLERPLFLLQQYARDMELGDDPLWRGIPRGRWAIAHNTVQMLYGPYLLAALTTTDEPVEPAEDLAGTTGEIWLDNESGEAFTADVYWSVLSRPFYWGPIVREWPAYAHRVEPEGRLVVLDPSGRVAAEERIVFTQDLSLPYNSQEYPFSGRVTLEIPGGEPGLYRVVLTGADRLPVRIALVSADGLPRVFPLENAKIGHAPAYHFLVPEDADEIGIQYNLIVLRKEMTVRVRDADGAVVREQTHATTSSMDDWTAWTLPTPADQRGRLWSLEVSPQLPDVQSVLLRLDGPPPVVGTSAEKFFLPESIPSAQRSEPQTSPENLRGPTVRVSSDNFLSFERGAQRAEGRYERIDSSRGTIEFWIRPDWDEMDYSDSDLLRFGSLRIYRRLQHGTYLSLRGGVNLQSGFLLRPGQWYHLAATWDLKGEDGEPRVTLYIDGVPMASASGNRYAEIGDWTGESLEIGRGAPFDVAGLRISARPRDDELLSDQFSPPADEQTLFLME